MPGELAGTRRILRAVADSAGWPWCDEHQAPRWHGTVSCAPRHADAAPDAPAWCYSCERMHGPMEWGDGCQDWKDIRAAEVEATAAGLERTARRYRRTAKIVELTSVALLIAMGAVLTLGRGAWVGSVALVLLLASAAVYTTVWPLARWQAVEARRAAMRAEQEGGRG